MLADFIDELKLESFNFSSHQVRDRERIALSFDVRSLEVSELLARRGVMDFVPFVTCGRIEFIYVSENFLNLEGFDRLAGFDAVEHLVSVVSGIKTIVVGETYVVSQFKKAFQNAVLLGLATRRVLALFSEVMRIAKKIRRQAHIVPVSFANVVRKIVLENLRRTEDKVLFVLGTGKIAFDIYRISGGFRKTLVFSHSPERAHQRVREIRETFGADSYSVSSVEEGLAVADVVVVATRGTGFLIDREKTRDVPRRMIIVDLSVPRTVSPDVRDNPNIMLYDIDSMRELSGNQNVLQNASSMVRDEIERLKQRVESDRKVKDIANMKVSFQKIISEHARRYLQLNDEEIERFSKSLSNRLLSELFRKRREEVRRFDHS